MGQRVNIQYSVDIGELDAEVQRLVERSRSRLSALVASFPSSTGVLSLETAEAIDSFRAELAEIDYCLDDVNKIITGYVSYRSGAMAEEISIPVENSDPSGEGLMHELDGPTEVLLAVEGAIEEFKKSNAPS